METRLKYLESDIFKMRYTLAVKFMQKDNTVLEIGCGKHPEILKYDCDFKSLYLIDPSLDKVSIANPYSFPIFTIKEKIQDYMSTASKLSEYSVIVLGVDVQGESSQLISFIEKADRVCIEGVYNWQSFIYICNELKHSPKLKCVGEIGLDFYQNDCVRDGIIEGVYASEFWKRIIMFFERVK